MRSWKTWIVAGLMVALLFRFYITLTDGFSISSIDYQVPHEAQWDVPQLSSEEQLKIQNILNQPYTYLGKGAQSYAFSSADGKYVLKFFKFKHLLPNLFVAFVPSWPEPLKKWKDSYFTHKEYRFQTLFSGHHLAYTQDKDNSALIYLHIIPTTHLKLETVLINKLGMQIPLDLNPIAFVIQKKGITARNLLLEKLKKGDMQGANLILQQMLAMIIREYSKGLYDRDHGVLHNIGFVEDVPFHLDVGKLTYDPLMKQTSYQAEDLFKVVHRILPWIHRNFPDYEEQAKTFMQNYLRSDLQIELNL